MKSLTFSLNPLSPFGSRLEGDTFFGQLCWTLHNIYGIEKLETLLKGYTANQPFAVVSDAFPAGYVGRPDLPVAWFMPPSRQDGNRLDRKAMKKRIWLPLQSLQKAASCWFDDLTDNPRLPGTGQDTVDETHYHEAGKHGFVHEEWQPHNQIDRHTGTTGLGEAGFAPFVTPLWRYVPGTMLHVHVCFDPDRIEIGMLEKAFRHIGASGYGADAGRRKRRLQVETVEDLGPLGTAQADAWLALAPFAPQQQLFDPKRSWYRVFTRFGRHGDIHVAQNV